MSSASVACENHCLAESGREEGRDFFMAMTFVTEISLLFHSYFPRTQSQQEICIGVILFLGWKF